MIQDLWLVLTRKLTKAKLDKLDFLATRLGRELMMKDEIIASLREQLKKFTQ